MVIKDKDAFIFEENDSLFLFIYMKLNETQLQNALPISYIENSDKCYLSCLFDTDGRDYIGQISFQDIMNVIESEAKCMNINNDYTAMKNCFPDLTYTLYKRYVASAHKQLNR